MQRLLATILLLSFAVGPGLNLSCLARCGSVSAAEDAAGNCHQPADSDVQVASAADCAEHQAVRPPALLIWRSVAASLVGPVAHTLPLPRQTLSVLHSAPAPLTPVPPLSFSGTPLRI